MKFLNSPWKKVDEESSQDSNHNKRITDLDEIWRKLTKGF